VLRPFGAIWAVGGARSGDGEQRRIHCRTAGIVSIFNAPCFTIEPASWIISVF
jgi:hypothetical protein